MLKFKKILIIFILSFFIFIPSVSAKYTFSIDINCSCKFEIQIDIPEQTDYMIYNLEDLLEFRDLQNNKTVNFKDKNVYLMNDIDLSEYYAGGATTWIPIGSEDNPFEGNFLGDFHKISNLKIETTESNQGLFGKNTGTIDKLKISGVINANNCENIGGIAGINSGTISYSNSEVTINGLANNVGGIAGRGNQGSFIYCKNYNSISGSSNIGGICGNCQNGYFWCCGNRDTATIKSIIECSGGIVRISRG